ncbi:hypothetical protein I79_021118 [Cricetulus griseus]|uniref:Uncharacterized protein n=1 Tax=Cricetulus griseus TaxID=10029 RepID=G3IBT5_CRIGR|nr:hypothetical protein I79_021118 [Cricetulus griseus]
MVLLIVQSVRYGTKMIDTELKKHIPKALCLCMSLYYHIQYVQRDKDIWGKHAVRIRLIFKPCSLPK